MTLDSPPQTTTKAAHQRLIAKWMRKRKWNFAHGTIRRRLYDLAGDRRPWWDWGHRLMTLTGSDFGGNWSEPQPPTWWYCEDSPSKRMWRTGYPLRSYTVVTDYEEFRRLTEGANEDEMYRWSAICVNQDGELILGKRYWGGPFYGLNPEEVTILRRYLRMWRRLDWFGLRTWLWKQGLHAAVYVKQPRTCQAVPPKGQGGYDHWFCRQPRGHGGLHRYVNYSWGEVDGEPIGAFYNPDTAR